MPTMFNIPNTNNYTVMAGSSVFIAKYTSGVLGAYNLAGNLKEDTTMSFDLERLENITNLWGLKTRDWNPIIGKNMTFTFVINELMKHTLEYALGSSGRSASQTVNVPQYEKVTFASGSAQVNSGSAINSVTQVIPESGDDTYTEGATGDYTVTAGTGTITLTGGSQISDGDVCLVLFDVSISVDQYPIMDDPNIRAAIRFVSLKSTDNEVGNNVFIDLPYVDLSVEGDIALPKSDTLMATLQASVSPDATNPTAPFGYWYQWR